MPLGMLLIKSEKGLMCAAGPLEATYMSEVRQKFY